MGMSIENTKQALIDLLSEESVQVLQVAYIYAKHYVDYGEDITKAFSTAVAQASVLEKVRQKAFVEAYDSFKKEYENRLKADMVAMLTDIQLELDEEIYDYKGADMDSEAYAVERCKDIIQQKINALKGEGE